MHLLSWRRTTEPREPGRPAGARRGPPRCCPRRWRPSRRSCWAREGQARVAVLPEDLAAQVRALGARYGIRRIRVFGSVARGTESSASDIDFLVEMEAERGLLERVALKQDLEDLLGRPIDLVTDRTLSRYLRETILSEAKPL